jgi:hypothetical protein
MSLQEEQIRRTGRWNPLQKSRVFVLLSAYQQTSFFICSNHKQSLQSFRDSVRARWRSRHEHLSFYSLHSAVQISGRVHFLRLTSWHVQIVTWGWVFILSRLLIDWLRGEDPFWKVVFARLVNKFHPNFGIQRLNSMFSRAPPDNL